MNLKLPDFTRDIVDKFLKNNYQIYLVGGAVRDFLLNRPITDWDFTTDAKPDQILELFPNAFYNNKFGTVGLPTTLKQQAQSSQVTPHDSTIEITTMRTEGQYQDSRHPDQINWTNDINEDLKRRDFTINAMALKFTISHQPSVISQIIDPFGGQKDLQHKLIREVGNPENRFQEDALRLIRAVRFATQLRFQIENQTLDSIKQNAQLIQNISSERIRDELLKIFLTDDPDNGIVLLRQTGLLKYILAELERCFGIVQQGPKHDRVYDIGEHSLLSLKSCPSKDPIVRFAALIHDIGKPDTYKVSESGNVTFYHHEVVGARIAKQIASRLHFSKDQKELITTLVRWHLFTVDENQTDSAIRRFIKNVGKDNLDKMWAIREADRLGGGTQTPTSWRHEHFKKRIQEVLAKPFSLTDLKINGHDVMTTLNIPPSRQVGQILAKLFDEVAQDQTKNDRNYLLNRLKDI